MKRSFYRTRPRRGVLLLVVLSVLLMFVLLALTYLTVATQYFEGASVSASLERSADDPRGELEEAFLQLLRDTLNPNSMLQGESLLADLYGNDGFIGQLAADPTYPGGNDINQGATNGQFIDLLMSPDPNYIQDTLGRRINTSSYLKLFDIDHDGKADVPHPTSGFYNGRLLTIISGPAAGSTARIVRYDANNDSNLFRFRIMFLAETNDRPIRASELKPGTRFIVNGRPFSGTGVGYRPGNTSADGKLDLQDADNHPYALLCNPVYISELQNGGAAHFGGADEGYDAADYQNQFLAAMPPNPALPTDILPSFHRRALIHYWDVKSGLESGDIPDDLQREILKRPNPIDHPNFPPLKNLIRGPWDVDNDSDGLAESVWIDAGFPVKTARDGRQYKPLVAFLCVDLDGRVNLNAHSNGAYAADPSDPDALELADVSLADGGSTATLARGLGYGPPEIGLNIPDLFDRAELKDLLRGKYGNGKPGTDNEDTPGAEAHFHDHPQNYWRTTSSPPTTTIGAFTFSPTGLSSFGSPPDLLGVSALGINAYGQPKYRMSSNTAQSFRSDSEYEISLSLSAPRGDVGPAARDTPFSSAELETLLRFFDSDAEQLPSRIRVLGKSRRNLVTTDQYGLPVPAITTTEELRSDTRFTNAELELEVPGSVADLLRLRLILGRDRLLSDPPEKPSVLTPEQEDLISADIAEMMSPDLLMGLRMDINRPIGNGKDDSKLNDSGYNVVDEPTEALISETDVDGTPFDHDNDGYVFALGYETSEDKDAYLARHKLARHLYVLLLTLRDNREDIDFQGGLFDDSLPVNQPELTTEMGLAQWAINAVDFRDADSIMTPFEFDINPFNGWDVDGRIDPNSPDNNHPDRRVVWGCERPELLITETLAFHDRRTDDTAHEDPVEPNPGDDPGTTDPDESTPDTEFDQVETPKSACFIELYNPWAGDARVPGELYYDHNGDIGPQEWYDGVILAKRAPGDDTPVWRMVIVAGDEKYKDPDHPTEPLTVVNIERSIYFVDPVPTAVQHGKVVYTSSELVHHITPGKFAVIGSAGKFIDGKYTTHIGDYSGADPNERRRIELDPDLDPSVQDASASPQNDTVQVLPLRANDSVVWEANHRPVAVVIDSPSLSISEPTDNPYPVIDPSALPDVPFDVGRDDLGDDIGDKNALMKDGTIDNYRVVHLQRLANPLQPYDLETNPYRTIDSAFINLTVFNGITSSDDPGYTGDHRVKDRFLTVQRGDDIDGNNDKNILWRSEIYHVWEGKVQDPGNGDGVPDYPQNVPLNDHVFIHNLQHTLGFLNRAYGPPIGTIESPEAPADKPFPWLTWFNRPYVSQYELMQVPKTSSSRLMAMFTLADTGTSAYEHSSTNDDAHQIPFGHLLNFFETDRVGGVKSGRAPQLGRIFDYLRVPSRFSGTTTRLDPSRFTGGFNKDDGRQLFHPPFNKVSLFRDPGRVNVNTIYSEYIWNAIQGDHPGPDYKELKDSRRGYSAPDSNSLFSFDLAIPTPTFFANPVRSFGSANKVPLTTLEFPEASVTLMRPNQAKATGKVPLLHNDSLADYNGVDRNSYFRYQSLQRTENLVTNRSNVFAIWITVGYFEVDENIGADGQSVYRLGLEMGTDSGQVKRHRAFYMVDRTIPVAFEPGKDHNVKRAVILRRFLE